MEVQDNRWCEWCYADRSKKHIDWYLWDGNEMSFCKKCAKEMGLTANDLIDM